MIFFLFQMKILRLCPFIVKDTDLRIHTGLVSYLYPYSCRSEVHDQYKSSELSSVSSIFALISVF